MILLLAVAAGLIAGLARAWVHRRPPHAPNLGLIWLVPVALLPQLIAFILPSTRTTVGDGLAAGALVSSQVLLLVFTWFNRRQPGMWALALGLILNLTVILLNGGLMPVSPETVRQVAPGLPPEKLHFGARVGASKDVLLTVAETRLWWLSDRFLLPAWSPMRAAFSLGDIFIAAGAVLLLWSIGRPVGQLYPKEI